MSTPAIQLQSFRDKSSGRLEARKISAGPGGEVLVFTGSLWNEIEPDFMRIWEQWLQQNVWSLRPGRPPRRLLGWSPSGEDKIAVVPTSFSKHLGNAFEDGSLQGRDEWWHRDSYWVWRVPGGFSETVDDEVVTSESVAKEFEAFGKSVAAQHDFGVGIVGLWSLLDHLAGPRRIIMPKVYEKVRVYSYRAINPSQQPDPTGDTEATAASQDDMPADLRGDASAPAKETTEETSVRRRDFVEPRLRVKGWSTGDWAQNSQPKVDYNTADDYLKGITNPRRSTRVSLAKGLGIQP